MSDKKVELQDIAKDNLPDPIIIIGLLEHQLDLMGQLIIDLAGDKSELSIEIQGRLDRLQGLLNYTSVNFEKIDDPMEAYKIPKATEIKGVTRKVQRRYLEAQMREGIFG
jgi:hypothetical protein